MGFIDLKSERLELVELGIFGLEDMHEYSTKEQVYKYLEFPPQKTKEETKLYLQKLIRRHQRENAHYWFVKLSEEDKKKLQDSIDSLKKVNEGSDIDMIEKSINDLNAIWQSLSEKLYQESKDADSKDQGSPDSNSNKKNKNDEVEEADFEEVK